MPPKNASIALAGVLLLTGCVGLSVGGGSRPQTNAPTLGQQLMDLQQARNSGAINEAEYQAQKARLLNRP